MGALILYSVPRTAATVACAALEETGAPYETVQVERHDRDTPPQFKQVNPHGRVPALCDGDVRLYETAAIILHLGDRCADSPLASCDGDVGAFRLLPLARVPVQHAPHRLHPLVSTVVHARHARTGAVDPRGRRA